MKSILAWLIAAAASLLAFFAFERPDLKVLAMLVPFVLWAAVLRGQIRSLELQLETREAELDQVRSELRRLQSRQAALADAPSEFHPHEDEPASVDEPTPALARTA